MHFGFWILDVADIQRTRDWEWGRRFDTSLIIWIQCHTSTMLDYSTLKQPTTVTYHKQRWLNVHGWTHRFTEEMWSKVRNSIWTRPWWFQDQKDGVIKTYRLLLSDESFLYCAKRKRRLKKKERRGKVKRKRAVRPNLGVLLVEAFIIIVRGTVGFCSLGTFPIRLDQWFLSACSHDATEPVDADMQGLATYWLCTEAEEGHHRRQREQKNRKGKREKGKGKRKKGEWMRQGEEASTILKVLHHHEHHYVSLPSPLFGLGLDLSVRIHVAVLTGTALPFWELQSVPFELSEPLLQLGHPIRHSLVVLGSSLGLVIFHFGCEAPQMVQIFSYDRPIATIYLPSQMCFW